MTLAWILATLIPPQTVEIDLIHHQFRPATIRLTAPAELRLVNQDAEPYTVEGAGLLPGDVLVPPHQTRTVPVQGMPGEHYAIIEEHPESEIRVELIGNPSAPPPETTTPFDAARSRGRQPSIPAPGRDPAYAAYLAFDIRGLGEEAQQSVLRRLYLMQEALSGDVPPAEFRLYFTDPAWRAFRPSVSMIYALGPSAYSARFGPTLASDRPSELHQLTYARGLGARESGQRDMLVRITSDQLWFSLRAVRWIWSRLGDSAADVTMAHGYANPSGRSPLLGGFYDGTGNPFGEKLEAAVFGRPAGNGTYLALFRIAFDERGFRAAGVAAQERMIGRERVSGRPSRRPTGASHKELAGFDPKVAILRQPYVFDDGPNETGLLFASLQVSPASLEKIFRRSILSTPRDPFARLMRFESAALYYVPSSPPGSFPGSLRYGGH